VVTVADLRRIDVLADQPEGDLAWLASVTDEMVVEPGAMPFRRGDPADAMTLVLSGRFQIFTLQGGHRVLWDTVGAGEATGLLPFSRMETYAGEGVAVETTRLGRVPKACFPELVHRMPDVATRLVGIMTDRVRESGRTEQQREKMVSLGKLSAGLAHELNNPAAAIRRSVADLRARLEHMPPLVSRLAGRGLSPDQLDAARGALLSCSAPTPGTLTTVERAEREDALADWLEGHAVPHAYVVAEAFADEGVSPETLDHFADQIPADALPDVLLWTEKVLSADRLLGQIESAAGRISGLVASVKSYTHMDGAQGRQAVDVHEGLDSTLTMLGHAVRARDVHVRRTYGDDVPPVMAYPGEINQVWTNLLDNALDAAPDGGHLDVTTHREGGLVCVHVVDDGPGIPDDVQARIFEPFFTTKEPGKGTGLGLDIARRIVTQHQGRITVRSRPGRTDFEVCLPIEGPDQTD
jgi:signal transduction histidine kinase